MRQNREFNKTNEPWNNLKLNHTTNIGAVMALIKNSKATCFEEWESYYFQTGRERLEKISTATNKSEISEINRYHGRTQEELLEIARRMALYLDIPVEKAYNYVYIRVIDETWLGYSRELKVLKQIQNISKKYFKLTASGVDSFTDTEYAVDFEVHQDDILVLGIQLKSVKYRDSTMKAVDDVKKINKAKNDEYTAKFGAPVLYLYVDKGEVVNMNELIEFLDTLHP